MHKIAFQFGSVPIYWYGVLVALGLLAGLWTAGRRAPLSGIRGETVIDLGPWLILGTILGARGLYVLSYWREDFAGRSLWQIFNIRGGGLIFYGGLIGASLACILYLRFKRLPLWKVADVLAPSIALGHSFGRIGCLMNGCCYGRACDFPWAIHFPNDHPMHGTGVHPAQIYEAVLNLGLYAALAWMYRRKKFDGQIFAWYLMLYAVLRAFVESFRGDYTANYSQIQATPGQMLSIPIFAAGVLLWWVLSGTKSKVQSQKS